MISLEDQFEKVTNGDGDRYTQPDWYIEWLESRVKGLEQTVIELSLSNSRISALIMPIKEDK